MAFSTNTTRNTNNNTNNDNWKAQGFLNFYLPNRKGERTKLGAIPLKDGKNNEKLLREWIEKDISAAIDVIMSNLIIEYRSATPSDDSAFALPG